MLHMGEKIDYLTPGSFILASKNGGKK